MTAGPPSPAPLSRWWNRILVGLPCGFLLLYFENLHCDQYASFFSGVFRPRHAEDGVFPGEVFPLLYQGGEGLVLRLYAAASILVAVFAAALAVRAHRRGRVPALVAMPVAGLLTALPAINARYLGQPILGERFAALGYPCTALGVLLVMLAIVPAVIVGRRKRLAREQRAE
jgi:hypothetical protein